VAIAFNRGFLMQFIKSIVRTTSGPGSGEPIACILLRVAFLEKLCFFLKASLLAQPSVVVAGINLVD